MSDLFPLLVAERRGVEVRQVPFAELVDSIDERTTLVASSLVQMQTGRIGDLDGICRRARAVGAKVFIDATHALPFVPVAPHIADIDFLVCHAYKHMLGARGTGVPVRPLRPGRRAAPELCELAWRARQVDALLRRTADAGR